MRHMRAGPLILALFLLMGCVLTTIKDERTGLFGDDPKVLLMTFKTIKNNETTTSKLEEMGFKILDVQNVETIVGVLAFQELYGKETFRNMDVTKLANKEFLEELNRFTLIKIPYFYTIKEEDRFYFTTKEEITTGDDISLSIVLLNDMVVYHAPRHVKINRKKSESAFAQGFLELFEKFAGVSDTLKDLAEKIRDLKSKD